MKYNPDKYYRMEYFKIGLILLPLMYLMYLNLLFEETLNNKIFINPVFLVAFLPMYGEVYSYSFPRQAMEIYETIVFRTFSKNVDRIMDFAIWVGIALSQILLIKTDNPVVISIGIFIFVIISYVFRRKSLVIGDKNTIIGKKRLSNSAINDISFESKKVIIKTSEGNYEIGNWLMKNKLWQLERVALEIINP
ncbi:hypothetical protein [Clostridium sp. DL1XJH146]